MQALCVFKAVGKTCAAWLPKPQLSPRPDPFRVAALSAEQLAGAPRGVLCLHTLSCLSPYATNIRVVGHLQQELA